MKYEIPGIRFGECLFFIRLKYTNRTSTPHGSTIMRGASILIRLVGVIV